jgi:heptose-I-phosphate ethanolaminephosphotransferase
MNFNNFPKLKPDKVLFQTLLFVFAVFLFSSLSLLLAYLLKYLNPSEYGLIQGNKRDFEMTYKEITFFASIVLSLFLLSVSFRHIKNKKLKVFLISFSLVYLCASFLMVLTDVIYYLIFACRITFSSFQTMLNTDAEEVKGFIKLYYSPTCILTILLFIALVTWIILKREKVISLLSSRSFFVVSLLISAFGIADFGQLSHSKGNGTHNVRYWDIIIGEYNEYHEFNRRLKAEKNVLNLSKEYDNFYKQDTLPKTLVLVISESLSKYHMSFYGYQRLTTPNLDSNRSIIKFNNCVTLAPLTMEAVPGLFCNGYLSKKINLIALLNKLGYETRWISNQSGWGKMDGSILLLSQLCGTSVFPDALADDDKSNASIHYDEELLPHFDKVLATTSKNSRLVVLHMMGCHFEYEKRYPAERNYFTAPPPAKIRINTERTQNIVNRYDNAVHYHDSVINEIIKVFSKHTASKNAALVFLSDHGEELFEHRDHAGHGYEPHKETSEVPYFVLLSEGFKKNYPETEKIMKERSNTAYSTSNNFHTVLHLLNINSTTHKTKILKNAFFSPSYDSTAKRIVGGYDYSQMVQ